MSDYRRLVAMAHSTLGALHAKTAFAIIVFKYKYSGFCFCHQFFTSQS